MVPTGSGLALEGWSGYGNAVRLLAWARAHLVVCDQHELYGWPVTATGSVAADAPVGLLAHDGPVAALASTDCAEVVAAGDDAGRLWLLAPDREERPLAEVELPAGVASLPWSACGSHLAAGCLDGSLHRSEVALT